MPALALLWRLLARWVQLSFAYPCLTERIKPLPLEYYPQNVRSAIQRSMFGCVAACVVPSGVGGAGGDEAGGGAEVAAVVVAGFAFVRAAGCFMAAGANRASSTMTGSGVMTVVEALPASPVCIELESFTAIRTGTLCG